MDMKRHRGTQNARVGRKGELLARASLALAIACALPGQVQAGTHIVTTETEFVNAINQANTDPDASVTIAFANDISTASFRAQLASSTKPITIDMQGHTLDGSLAYLNGTGGSVTIAGTIKGTLGGTRGAAGTSGVVGLALSNSTLSSSIINNGWIIGGDGSDVGKGGGDAVQMSLTTFMNNGTLQGGAGTTAGGGGTGALVRRGSTLNNYGTIIGGASQTSSGGAGIDIGGPGGSSKLINYADISGGDALNGTSPGGTGLFVRSGTDPIVNAGTIEGGAGGTGGVAVSANAAFTLINSGTIRAGAGQAVAIQAAPGATNAMTLELHAGSSIVGNVVANALATTDTLRLGGDGSSTFDVSSIGATAQYQNFDQFEKTGNSTWALTGTGTSATPWVIQQGTLQLGNGSPSGSIIGDVTNNGTLAFNRSDVVTFDNVITGSGAVVQAGSGTTVFNNAFTYTGPTSINLGALEINGSITSPVMVNAAGTLGGTGTITGDVTNAGTVAPGNASTVGTLTVGGNYIGQGGTLAIKAVLDGDTSSADRMVVTGDTSGTTNVKVTKIGGNGAQTTEGIKIVDVQGASSGTFNLVGDYVFQGQQAVVSGAYAYRLYKSGVSTPADGDWYLRSGVIPPTTPTDPTAPADPTSPTTPTTPVTPTAPTEPAAPLYAPGVPLYEAYAGVMQRLNELGTLQQRVGSRDGMGEISTSGGSKDGMSGDAVWVRVDGGHSDLSPETTTTGTHYDASTQKAQVGMDFLTRESEAGVLVAAATAQYGKVTSDVSSMFGLGEIKTKSYGVGGTLTWYGKGGFYVDAQAQYNWYRSDLNSRTLGRSLVDGNDGSGYNLGVEAGQKIAIGDNLSVIPQGQLTYSSVSFDSFDDPYGARVRNKDSDSFIARAGVALDHESSWRSGDGTATHAHVYGIANLYYDFLDGAKVDVSVTRLVSEDAALWGGLGVGGSISWKNDRYKIYGEALAQSSIKHYGDSQSFGARLGFSMSW